MPKEKFFELTFCLKLDIVSLYILISDLEIDITLDET